MDLLVACSAGLTGYLVGGISFARIVVRARTGGEVAPMICAAATVFGHNWPVYYRFRGGNGQSVILGGMLAIDWVGALVTNGIALGMGMMVLRDGLIGDIGGIALLIPWLWWRTDGDPAHMAYAVAVSIAFWVSFRGTVSGYLALKRAGHLPTAEGPAQPADDALDDGLSGGPS